MGTWYEIQHSKDEPFGSNDDDCTAADYTDLDTEAGTFVVHNSYQLNLGDRTGVYGTGTVAGVADGGQIIVNFSDSTPPTEPNYFIMETDYTSYSMVYACEANEIAYLWILSREPTLAQATIDTLNASAAE